MNGSASQFYSGAWLAMKLGVEPRRIDIERRSGELLGIPADRGDDHVYPVFQFGLDGRPLPAFVRAVRTAREAGLDDAELYELLLRREGMTGTTRLADALREGREEHVLEAIRAAAPRRAR